MLREYNELQAMGVEKESWQALPLSSRALVVLASVLLCACAGGIASVAISRALPMLPAFITCAIAGFVAVSVAIPITRRLVAWRIEKASLVETQCRACGYNLSGAPGPRCPECGELFDKDSISGQGS